MANIWCFIVLNLNRRIRNNLFEFIGDGWLFNYMDEIDTKLKDYKEIGDR